MTEKTYTFLEFAKLLNIREQSLWHIIDVGDILPYAIIDDYRNKRLPEVIDSLQFSESDVEIFRNEFRRRRHEEFNVQYSDVLKPDEGLGTRGLEFGPGWIGLVSEYCDQLRLLNADGWSVKLRWGKEKFGSLRLFTDAYNITSTPLQYYWMSRLRERVRRQSLRTCQECGAPGRLRLGFHAATLCDRHKHLVGEPRAEDGVILDPDRLDEDSPPTWTDAELGLDDGESMDMAKQMEIEFRPFLSPGLRLTDDDLALVDLRRKLIAVDRAIGRHHAVQFKLFADRYEITIDNEHPTSTVDAIQRERIVDEIEMIMSGEQV